MKTKKEIFEAGVKKGIKREQDRTICELVHIGLDMASFIQSRKLPPEFAIRIIGDYFHFVSRKGGGINASFSDSNLKEFIKDAFGLSLKFRFVRSGLLGHITDFTEKKLQEWLDEEKNKLENLLETKGDDEFSNWKETTNKKDNYYWLCAVFKLLVILFGHVENSFSKMECIFNEDRVEINILGFIFAKVSKSFERSFEALYPSLYGFSILVEEEILENNNSSNIKIFFSRGFH